jgi:hypothetical protein
MVSASYTALEVQKKEVERTLVELLRRSPKSPEGSLALMSNGF